MLGHCLPPPREAQLFSRCFTACLLLLFVKVETSQFASIQRHCAKERAECGGPRGAPRGALLGSKPGLGTCSLDLLVRVKWGFRLRFTPFLMALLYITPNLGPEYICLLLGVSLACLYNAGVLGSLKKLVGKHG